MEVITIRVKLNDTTASADLQKIQQQIDTLKGQSTVLKMDSTPVKNAATAVSNLNAVTKKTGDTFDNVLLKIIKWKIIGDIFYKPLEALQEAIETLKEVDSQLVTIQKVTDLTAEGIDELTESAYGLASAYGATATAALESATVFARAGYDEQIEELSELSLLVQNIGDLSTDNANKFLLAADAAWDLNGSYSKLMNIIDGMNEVTNQNATDMEKLAEGITVAGSVFAAADESVETFTALLGTGTAAAQRSGSEIAKALRAILMNIRQIKGETEDGELVDGESIAKASNALKEYAGISTIVNGELKKSSTVLEELATKWDTLDSIGQSAIAESLAGKLRANTLLAIMENWETYESMIEQYANSAGSALKENEIYLESWEAKTNQLSAAWTEFVSEFVDTDIIKGFLTVLTDFIKTLDGGVIQIGLIAVAIWLLITAFKALSTKLSENAMQAAALKIAEDNLIASSAGLTYQTIATSVATKELTVAQGAQLAATNGLKTATQSLWAVLKANPIGLVVTLLSLLTLGISALSGAAEQAEAEQQELVDAGVDASAAFDEEVASLDTLYKKINDESTTLEELVTAMGKLKTSYGEQITDIKDINEARKKSIELIKAEAEAQARETILTTGSAYLSSKTLLTEKSGDYTSNKEGGITIYEAVERAKKAIREYNEEAAKSGTLAYWKQEELARLEEEYKKLSEQIADAEAIVKSYETAQSILNGTYEYGTKVAGKYGDTVPEVTDPTKGLIDTTKELTDVQQAAWEEISDVVDYALKKMKFAIEDVQVEIDALNDALDAAVAPFETQIKELEKINDLYAEQIDDLERARDLELRPLEDEIYSLEQSVENFEDAIYNLEQQIKPLEKSIEDLEDAQEEALKPIDAQITSLEEQISALEEAKSLREDEVELEERLLAIEEAKQALANAQNERTIREYSSGGWKWVADQSAISDAKTDLAKAEQDLISYYEDAAIDTLNRQVDELNKQRESIISLYETQIEAIEEQIEIIEEERDAITEQKELVERNIELIERQKEAIEREYELTIRSIEDLKYANEETLEAIETQKEVIEESYNALIEAQEKIKEELESQYDEFSRTWERLKFALEEPITDIAAALETLKTSNIPAMGGIIADVSKLLSGLGVSVSNAITTLDEATKEAENKAAAAALAVETASLAKYIYSAMEGNPANDATLEGLKKATQTTTGATSHMFYDSGGIATSKGYMAKDVDQPETVLNPELTAKILTPTTNTQFTGFVKSLGLLFGVAESASAQMSTTSSTSTTNNLGGNTYINGVQIGESMMNQPLSEVLSTLSIYSNERR